jgi:hypothetical protein
VTSYSVRVQSSFKSLEPHQMPSLYYNHLKGRIPHSIGSHRKLVILNLSVNNLTGSIPCSIGNMTALSVISLSENYVKGSIPDEFGILTGMSTLFLGFNSLAKVAIKSSSTSLLYVCTYKTSACQYIFQYELYWSKACTSSPLTFFRS